ncbi:MAG: ABC transporter ATP-binding protein [Lachnospiraceae bacterium]|nr:ABC transporter ATP-binding protein [Lachnospiraceae bacterium]
MGENTMIATRGLTKVYGEKVAVNHLDLSINEGEIFGLLGPNGAGKTTTILMLLGLTEPTLGEATINGIDCTRNSIQVKRITGYLPDNVGFYPDMTGRENLRFTGRLNGLDGKKMESKIDDLLERVGMTYAQHQKTGTYSKGMRQRLGIADVLMKDPKVIIMDEPTLGLDPEGMREFLTLIKQLSVEDGRTVLVSSHQLYQIQQICDRVGIFVSGSLVAAGKIEDLGRQLAKEGHYTLEVAAYPCDDRFLGFIHNMAGVTGIEKEGDKFVVHSSRDLRKEITGFLGTNRYTLLHLRQKGGDLDEIYRCYFEKAGQDEKHEQENKNGKHIFGTKQTKK